MGTLGRLAAAALLAAALATPARAAGPNLRVTVNGKGSERLSADAVDTAADVLPFDLPVTQRSASRDSRADGGGTSLAAVAELAHVPARFVNSITVKHGDPPIVITKDEIRDGFHGDPKGDRFAVIYFRGGTGGSFVRPLRGDDDVNASDIFTDNDLSIDIATTNGTPRDVNASADDTTPDPSVATGFSARVTNPGDATYTYSWDFGDGNADEGATPSHAFAAGHYRVTVTAIGDDGSAGVSDPIELQVGKPAATVTPAPSVTTTPSPSSAGPGDQTGPGGGNATSEAGTHGPAESPTKQGGRTRPRSRATATPSPAATATATRTPAPTSAATPSPTPGASGSTPTPTPSPGHTASPAPKPTAPARPAAPVSITGTLLAGAGSPTQLEQVLDSVSAAPPAAARRGGGGGGTPLGWVGGSGLLLVLLAGGAAAELRGLRR